jgi:hypothetical protein
VYGIISINLSEAQPLLSYQTSETNDRSEVLTETPRVFTFTGYSDESELKNISAELAGSHPFGGTLARKLYLFNKKYTSEVPLAPGNPATKTEIKKPVIYNSVKRIDRDLKRSVKRGEIDVTKASQELNIVLDVALNILTAETKEFEKAIESASSTDSKIDLYTNRVKLVYYNSF